MGLKVTKVSTTAYANRADLALEATVGKRVLRTPSSMRLVQCEAGLGEQRLASALRILASVFSGLVIVG